MLRTVTLHGRLADRYGRDPIEVDADNIHMLFSALNCAYPDFLHELRQEHQLALLFKEGDKIEFLKEAELGFRFSSKPEIHLATGEQGAGAEVYAFVYSAMTEFGITAATVAASIAYIAVNIAIALAVSAITTSLADKPGAGDGGSAEERRSFLFDQAENLTGQGHPVPLVYGRFRTGSVVISSDISPEKVPFASADTVQVTSGESATGNLLRNDIDGSSSTVTGFTVNGTAYTPGQTGSVTNSYTVTVASNGDYTVTTNAAYFGTAHVPYTITSSNGQQSSSQLVIEVTPPRTNYDWEGGG